MRSRLSTVSQHHYWNGDIARSVAVIHGVAIQSRCGSFAHFCPDRVEREISLSLVHRGGSVTGQGINFIDVPSLDAAPMHIADNGGDMIHPRVSVPGVGHVAYCRDTEGNSFAIIEMDSSAA